MPQTGSLLKDMTGLGWQKLVILITAGISICAAVSIAFNYILLLGEATAVRSKATFSAIVLPVILAGPLFFYLSLKLRQLSHLNRQLKHLADHDPLTALLTRRAFLQAFDDPRCEEGGRQGALLLIDVDHFKKINDRWGHAAGDQVLQLIASGIRSELRATDIAGRFGGEEFVICLHGADTHDAMLVAKRVHAAIEALRIRTPDGSEIRVTISIGLIAWSGAESFETLYHQADCALYEAKARGRNRIEVLKGLVGEPASMPV